MLAFIAEKEDPFPLLFLYSVIEKEINLVRISSSGVNFEAGIDRKATVLFQ